MPLAPFATLEARVNRAVESRLSSATATYQGGEPFGILLDREQTGAFGGDGSVVDAPALTASFDTAHTPGLSEGGELVVNGVQYCIAQGVQPDASGWVTVVIFEVR